MPEKKEERPTVDELCIDLTPKHRLTVAALVAIFLWAITTTALLIENFRVKPMERDAQRLNRETDQIKRSRDELQTSLRLIRDDYETLLRQLEMPNLLAPTEGAMLVEKQIRFGWDYVKHNSYQRYILELRNLSSHTREIRRFNVSSPDLRRMHLPSEVLSNGEYLWRVVPGYLVAKESVAQGPSSSWGSFTVHNSIIDRIKDTRILRVAMSPTFSGIFNRLTAEGVEGYDVDLINWIGEVIGRKLQIKEGLRVEIMDAPWGDLFKLVQKGEVDLAISEITRARYREEKYKRILFSQGYYEDYPVFVQQRPQGKYPSDLKGKVVGVTKGTTNSRVATFASQRYRFEVDATYDSNADLFDALEHGDVDFGLVDYAFVVRDLNRRFFQFGPLLDDDFADFYQKELGSTKREYAIAVVDERPNDATLLGLIDEILASQECKEKSKELKEKYELDK